MYEGVIYLPSGQRGSQIILGLGLILRNQNEDGSYNITVSEHQLRLLDNFWGEVIWSLKPVALENKHA